MNTQGEYVFDVRSYECAPDGRDHVVAKLANYRWINIPFGVLAVQIKRGWKSRQ